MLDEVIEAIDAGVILYPNEELTDVIGYEGLYEVTSFGRIWGIKRQHWLSISIGTINGYPQVNLCKNGIALTTAVHSIVLEAFKGAKPSSYHECRHLDSNPLNNHIDNLEWGTPEQNYEDRVNNGTGNDGENNGRAILDSDDAKEIFRLYHDENVSAKELANKYCVTTGAIYPIVKGDRW